MVALGRVCASARSPGRHRRQARLAARRRHHPRRDPRPRCSSTAADRVRLAAVGLVLPHPQRPPAVRRRGSAPAGPRRTPTTTPDRGQVGFPQAFAVGAAQAFALIPGLSRSGATMGGSPRRAFGQGRGPVACLLATPIIGRRRLLELPELARLAGGRNPRPSGRRLAGHPPQAPTSRSGSSCGTSPPGR